MKIKDRNKWRRYKRLIAKKVRGIRSIPRKQKILTGILVLLLITGVILGNTFGRTAAEKEAKKKIAAAKKETEQVKADWEAEKEEAKKEAKREEQIKHEEERPWNLVLVNTSHPMQDGYVPELATVGDVQVDVRIKDALEKMLKDARKAGVNPIPCSGYRSVERQTQIFNETVQGWLDKGENYWTAYDKTSQEVQLPGTSEHGVGLAVDIISNQYSNLDAGQADTPEAKWLQANCQKYGFILRYPPDKQDETGIIYEAWHYRYVGEEDAKKIMESGQTLEEYLSETY